MDFIDELLGKLKDWAQQLLDALTGPTPQPEPEPIPIPVDGRRRYR